MFYCVKTEKHNTYISDIGEGSEGGQRSQHGCQGAVYDLQEDNKNLVIKRQTYNFMEY